MNSLPKKSLKRKSKRKSKRKIRRARKSIFIFCLLLIICIILSVVFREKGDKTTYWQKYSFLDNDENALAVEDTIVDSFAPITYMDGEIYLPVEAVKAYIDEYIYWDENEGKLIITTGDNVIRMQSDELSYYVNNEPVNLNLPIYSIEGTAYLPRAILQEIYSVSISYSDENNIVSIMFNNKAISRAEVINTALVRYEPNDESDYITKVKKGDTVNVYDTSGDFCAIATDDGFVGYIPTKCIGEITEISPEPNTTEPVELWKPENGKINMYFEQVFNVNANYSSDRKQYIDGVDVVSPTWFSFENNEGDIKNIADKSYVDWVHKNGYQVWGLLTDNFNAEISNAILSNTATREHVIKQLLAYASLYELDGINIDFEAVPKSDGDNFVQFLRELTPVAHAQGVVVSVDTFVPKPWTAHYNRGALNDIVDYIVVMGYDEHYSGSDKSGSVASLSWSKEAIESTLKQGVDKEKLILGIPFYTRIWTETATENGIELGCKSYSMQGAYDFMEELGAEFSWLEDMGQNYAQASVGNVTYKCWLEDSDSVKLRLELIKEYDIAGAAAWKRGMETSDIWSMMKNELKE